MFEFPEGSVQRTESVVERMLRDLLAQLPNAQELELNLAALDRHAHPTPADQTDQAEPAAAEPRDDPADQQVGSRTDVPIDVPADEAQWRVPGVHDTTAPGSDAPASATADPGAEIRALAVALDAVAAQDSQSLPEAQALARARWLLQATERMKALSVQALADVETRTLFTADDSPSVHAWVKSLAVPGVDNDEITLARRLRRVPRIAEEIAAGRMSTRTGSSLSSAVSKARPFLDRPDGQIDGQDGEPALYGVLVDGVCQLIAEQIGRAADAAQRLTALRTELEQLDDPTRTQLSRWEAALVVLARESDPALLPSAIALLVDALLPAEHDKRARRADDARALHLRRNSLGSGWHVKGDLDDETGELLATVIDAAEVTDPAGPDDTRARADGQAALDDPTLPPQDWPVDQPAPRSKAARRHDALKRGLQALLDSGALGVRGKLAPHIAVTSSLDFVHGVPGSLPARTDHGARLSREQIRRLLCRSTFTRLVLDATNRVIQVSHTQRTSTALERLILKVQGGATCSGSGCARGPATGHRLIPHHGDLFSTTGTTELDDTVMLCEIDHDHELHTNGRAIRLKDGRILGPNGWIRR